MPKPIEDVMKACKICIAWTGKLSHADCPYFLEERCEDALQDDVSYYLNKVKVNEQPELPGLESK